MIYYNVRFPTRFATGYRNATYMPELLYDQNVESIYLKLRNRNLCNHRDYQVCTFAEICHCFLKNSLEIIPIAIGSIS